MNRMAREMRPETELDVMTQMLQTASMPYHVVDDTGLTVLLIDAPNQKVCDGRLTFQTIIFNQSGRMIMRPKLWTAGPSDV
jgi:hypothetical protein